MTYNIQRRRRRGDEGSRRRPVGLFTSATIKERRDDRQNEPMMQIIGAVSESKEKRKKSDTRKEKCVKKSHFSRQYNVQSRCRCTKRVDRDLYPTHPLSAIPALKSLYIISKGIALSGRIPER